MSLSSFASASTNPDVSLKNIFCKPLILGASVSADYFTESPGKRLALRYTTSDQIKVIAQKGKPGKDILKSVQASDFSQRSVVVGMDLFFWDSFQKSPTESLQALDRLVKMTGEAQIPLVLAEVPVFTPQLQPSALALNQKLQQICQSNQGCRLLPLNKLLHQLIVDGYIVQNGQKYNLASLLPDGLHIASPASEFLADQIKLLF